jgi:hypothetical protein
MSDILLLLSPPLLLFGRDAEMRAVEEGYREAFVSQPSSMLEAWRQGKLLLDVFSTETLPTFVYEVSEHTGPLRIVFHCFRGELGNVFVPSTRHGVHKQLGNTVH